MYWNVINLAHLLFWSHPCGHEVNRLSQGDDIDLFGMFEELEKLLKSISKRVRNLCCASMKAASVTDLHFLEDADLRETFF